MQVLLGSIELINISSITRNILYIISSHNPTNEKVVEALDGVKVYNVSAGKTLPEWLAERQKNLKKNVDFQSRIELIQDCAFPTSAQKLQFTRDEKFLIGIGKMTWNNSFVPSVRPPHIPIHSIGTYKPRVRIWELSELSIKVERYLDCDAVDFAVKNIWIEHRIWSDQRQLYV